MHLGIPLQDFQAQMEFLHRHGYRTVSMGELMRHVRGEALLPRRSVAITFDDGFRDNLVEAGPVLEKFGLRAAIFVITSCVRPPDQPPSEVPRPFNEAHLAARRGDFGDFLSGEEMKAAAARGVFEFHSHGHRHEQVFRGGTITGVFPTTDSHWGIVSAYRRALETGEWPVFVRGAGLVNLAWRPKPEAVKIGLERWHSRGSAGDKPDLPASAFEIERLEDFRKRVLEDFRDSLANLGAGNSEKILCWPWGASTPEVRSLAKEAGFTGALGTGTGPVCPGCDEFDIRRFPVKKAGLARFALGIWLRSHSLLAKLYGFLHR